MKSCFVSTSLPSHCAELSTVVRYLGLKMTEVEVQELFDEFDEDKSGSIEFDEFLILISKKVIILVFERKYDDIIIWCKKEWNNEIFMLYVFFYFSFLQQSGFNTFHLIAVGIHSFCFKTLSAILVFWITETFQNVYYFREKNENMLYQLTMVVSFQSVKAQ